MFWQCLAYRPCTFPSTRPGGGIAWSSAMCLGILSSQSSTKSKSLFSNCVGHPALYLLVLSQQENTQRGQAKGAFLISWEKGDLESWSLSHRAESFCSPRTPSLCPPQATYETYVPPRVLILYLGIYLSFFFFHLVQIFPASRATELIISLCVCERQTGFHYVALTVLEYTMQTRLASSSQRSAFRVLGLKIWTTTPGLISVCFSSQMGWH